MLTVDYDRLGLRAGDRVLDLGCGFGRHVFESLRRGADVVACDMAMDELGEVRKITGVMRSDGELDGSESSTQVNGDATCLPFADDQFDRIIASEVLEHVPDDRAALTELTRVLRPGGVMAVTVPAWFPETVCWRLSDEYYAPKSPGGHVRIYTRAELLAKLRTEGLEIEGTHHAHALHSPYWWLRCAVGPHDDNHSLVRKYHQFLTWDIVKRPLITRVADKVLNPVLGKSLVVYSTKPVAEKALTEGTQRVAA